jgi:hypothetical protein
VQLEIVDIWHFGMSALFERSKPVNAIAAEIAGEIEKFTDSNLGVREATEALALHSLETKDFSIAAFWQLMAASELDFNTLYKSYVGKNVLNFFRQDNGYQDGSYIKQWQGREDNEHLIELVATLDSSSDDFSDLVYAALAERYQNCIT